MCMGLGGSNPARLPGECRVTGIPIVIMTTPIDEPERVLGPVWQKARNDT
jgi:hypothetical protein